MKNLKYYFQEAYKEHWAIGQFNFSTFEQVKGIVQAAQNLKAPIILGTSEGESQFVGLEEAVAMRNVLRKKTGVPIFLNLDHGKSAEYLKKAIEAGYDMVHYDGSKLSLDENIKFSKVVKGLAFHNVAFHNVFRKKVVVEGEVGRFGTDASRVYTEKFEIKEEDLTKVEDVKQYLNQAKVDVLAISVGTFHGIGTGVFSPNLRLDRLREIAGVIKIPLVLHGGPGTREDDIKEAIKMGIMKVNINTETRLAFSSALRRSLEENKDEIVPYRYLPSAISAVRLVVEKYISMLGSKNKS